VFELQETAELPILSKISISRTQGVALIENNPEEADQA
jgi:hypothetical protein